MKIKFLATNNAPDKYSFSGDTITIFHNDESESVDLSPFEEGDQFEGVEPEVLNLTGIFAIRAVERAEGELHVTLCQTPPITKITYKTESGIVTLPPDADPPEEYQKKIEHRGGRWQESDWMGSDDYDPDELYIEEIV